jgi:hypothetical protein
LSGDMQRDSSEQYCVAAMRIATNEVKSRIEAPIDS